MAEQVSPPTLKVKGVMSVVAYVVDKPQALAIIFALVLLGMFLGIVPSTLSNNLVAMDTKLDTIVTQHTQIMSTTENRYNGLQQQITTQNTTQTAQNEKMIQIMRGMCLIIAKQSADAAALSYCNP